MQDLAVGVVGYRLRENDGRSFFLRNVGEISAQIKLMSDEAGLNSVLKKGDRDFARSEFPDQKRVGLGARPLFQRPVTASSPLHFAACRDD